MTIPSRFTKWFTVIAGFGVALAPHALAQAVTATVTTGAGPWSFAVSPAINKVYVANQLGNNITVIDGATHATSTITTGLRPLSLAVNSVTNKVYVANWDSNDVTVIDGATNKTSTVVAGLNPFSPAVNPVTNMIYVANGNSNNVTVIDGVTNSTSTVAVGSTPYSVAVNSVTNKVYVANINSNNVTVIDGATNRTSTIAAGSAPYSVAVNAVTNRIYVANRGSNNVTVIDGATNATSTIAVGSAPHAVAVNSASNKVYVANWDSNNVTVINGANNRTSTVTVGTTPLAVAVNAASGKIYVVNNNGNKVTVIDGATHTTSTVTAGRSPLDVAVNPVTSEIYVANFNSNNVTVFGADLLASATIPLAASGQPGFTLSATSATANASTPGTYIAYGDSITYGAAASSAATRYTNLIAADVSAALTNRGVGGAQACDVAQTILLNDNPPASQAPLQTILLGTNDAFVKGAGPYESVFKSCHMASLAWLAIPSSQKTAAQSCTQSGYWEPDNTYLPGLAAQSYGPGATLSCPLSSYGGPIYLWYRVTDSNAGSFSYSVDGGPSQPVNSFSSTPIATWNGGVDGVFVVRMTGLAAGSHTVVVTVTSSVVSILAVGSLNPVAQFGAPEVFAGGVIREQYDSIAASTAAYDADAAADVALLSSDGLPVYFVPVRNYVNADTDMFDGFHPDDLGHLHLRDAFESLGQFPLNSSASFSSVVTVTPLDGFNLPVMLAASGWPAGITGTFGTNPATASSTVTVSAAASVAPGPYMLTVVGTSGNLSASTAIPITVAAPPSFTLSATAATATTLSPGTSTVTVTPTHGFHSVVEFSASGWPAGITAAFGTNPAATSSTVSISVTASVPPGLYSLTVAGTLGTLSVTTTLALTVNAIQSLGSSATFTGLDASTQGTWGATYGGDGYVIANGANNLPGYASIAFTGASTYSWTGSTSDVRALQSSPGSTSRIASCYYSLFSSNFKFNLNLSDGMTHQVAIYLLDWDTTLRSQTIEITDSLTGILIDSRSFSQFNNGVYGVWNIKGNVTINVTAIGPGGAVVSGIFFGPGGPSATPGFTLSAAAAAANAGSTGTSTVTVTRSNGFSSGVTLAASGWPTGITGTFAANPANASSTVTIGVATSVTPGPYTLTVTGTSGALTASTTIPLTVNAAPQPSFTLNANAATAIVGSTGASTVTLTPGNGFNSGVTLATSGWPTGISGTFGTNPAISSSIVSISVGANVSPGAYTLAVNGTSGILSASTTISLTVSAEPNFSMSSSSATATVGSTGTSTVTITPANGFNSPVTLAAVAWPPGISGTFGTNPATASSVVTISVTTGVAPGPYTLTVSGTAGANIKTTTIALTVTLTPSLGAFANFTGLDTATQGTWSGTYGSDGFIIANSTSNLPSYATVAFTDAPTYTWAGLTSDIRALQTSPGLSTRIASSYYASTSAGFNVNVSLNDGATHQVAIYLLDWDTTSRVETITITDPVTGNLLDSRTISGFHNGTYSVWNIKGTVTINVAAVSGNPVASGIFFAPASGGSAPPSFSMSASAATANVGSTGTSTVTITPANGFNSAVTLATSGWPAGITGAFGTNPATGSSMVTVTVGAGVAPGAYSLTVAGTSGALSASTTIALDVNAAVQPSFTLSATAAAASAGATGTSTVTITPANGFNSAVTLAASSWPAGITATFGTNPATGSSIVTISVGGSVTAGPYTLTVTGTSGALSTSATIALIVNAASTGLGSSASFAGLDGNTEGAWTGGYGAAGYLIANGSSSNPSYATVGFSGALTYTWAVQTTDVRALQSSAGASTGIASAYTQYSSQAFTINIGILDGNTHEISFYLLDWDSSSRSETITVLDAATGTVLDTETFSGFHNGQYASWNIRGSVIIKVTPNGFSSPVVSGVFFN